MSREIINRRMNIVAEDGAGYVDVIEPNNRASDTDPGVVKVSPSHGITVDGSGQLAGYTRTLAQYKSGGSGVLISKGTLEHIIEYLIGAHLAPELTPGNSITGMLSITLDQSGKYFVSIVTP